MTDARFLVNNSVTDEANYAKCKMLMQVAVPIKVSKSCRNRWKGSPVHGESLPKSGNFWHFGAAFPSHDTDWREIFLGYADQRAPRLYQISHESVQRVAPAGRKCWFFCLVNKFICWCYFYIQKALKVTYEQL